MSSKTGRPNSRDWWSQFRRPRLTLGLVIGLVVYALLFVFTDWSWRPRFVAGWDIGAACALAALFIGQRKSSAETIKRRAQQQDGGKWVVLILALFAATASMGVIATEMPLVKNAMGLEQALRAMFMIFTIVLSWTFIHTVFAMHYAHDYYMKADLSAPSPTAVSQRLVFPGQQMPTYGDFLYFSFTIGMTFQVSDVQVADAEMRRLVLLHGATSFFYTTGILALAINLVAGLI